MIDVTYLLANEELSAGSNGVGRPFSEVSFHSWVGENFEVISTFESFIPKEVNFVVFIITDEIQAKGLVPSLREDIEGDLSADGVR